jgi:hypothetical protein
MCNYTKGTKDRDTSKKKQATNNCYFVLRLTAATQPTMTSAIMTARTTTHDLTRLKPVRLAHT